MPQDFAPDMRGVLEASGRQEWRCMALNDVVAGLVLGMEFNMTGSPFDRPAAGHLKLSPKSATPVQRNAARPPPTSA
jgi:hypothetical protein